MDRHELVSAIFGQTKKLRVLSEKVGVDFGIDDIHAFRLAVKKLRALTRLIGPADRRLPKGVRRIYKAIGNIRNLQLLRQSIVADARRDHVRLPKGFFSHLDSRLVTAKQEARKLIANHGRFRKLPSRWTQGLPPRLTRDMRVAFVEKKSGAAGAPMLVTAKDEVLHSQRKSMKDILYTWSYLGHAARRRAVARFGRHEVMKMNAGLLGDYLDLVIQLRLLGEEALFPGEMDRKIVRHFEDRRRARRDDMLCRLKTLPDLLRGSFWHPALLPQKAILNPPSAGNPTMISADLRLD